MSKSCLMRFLVAILVLYLQVYTLYSVAKGVERHPSAIVLPPHPTAVMRLAGDEVQKYVYLRTGNLLPICQESVKSALAAIWLACDTVSMGTESFRLSDDEQGLHIMGGSEIGLLYGVYQYAELLGVTFSLHGDVIPDAPFAGSLIQCGKGLYEPLFIHRGLLPFHDFPEGPDLWNEDMYKSCITQMVKLKMNFFSLHTYPCVEPNVWVGLLEDVDTDGNVSFAYPTTLANTSRPGDWGYSAMDTRDYCCGAASLFADSIYASPVMRDVVPRPRNQQEMVHVFDKTGQLFDNAFSFGRRLGVKFCAGLETPLSIPREVSQRLQEKGINPQSKEAKRRLYQGIFTRLQRRHPLDYFWLWTPEGWTWGTTSKESVDATVDDVTTARRVLSEMGNPFGFGLSGWMLGPADNTRLFDSCLPKGDFLSSLSRLVGQERIDLGYRQLAKHRPLMPLLWLEDDPALTTPQFWVGRLRSDIAESYAVGCSGIVGNFWRTRAIDPNVLAVAQACWDQQEWNPYMGKPLEYQPAPINDIRIAGTGTNYYRHIKGTEDQYLYNTQRYDLKGYKVKVPNGRYKVTFQMSETRYDKAGERIFGLRVQDKAQIDSIDIFRQVGRDTVYAVTSDWVEVSDYMLRIDFLPIVGPTCMSAFVIEGRTADANQVKGTPYKRSINVGGGLYKDYEADLSERMGNKPPMPRDLSATSLYLAYARSSFGDEVAEPVARIFSSVDGTVGNEGYSGFRMPRPAGWITGPGVIQPNETPWSQEAVRYSFVDSLYALRPLVNGAGNLARYDYWLNTFSCLRTMGELGCMRGQMDILMRKVASLDTPAAQQQCVEEQVLPLRVRLARLWETLMGHVLQTVSSTGEVGTIINLESQTRKTYAFLTKYDAEIVRLSGNPLPASCTLSASYTQSPRLVVLNGREVLQEGEPYRLQVIVLGKQADAQAPVLRYRTMGKGRYKALPMQAESGNIYSVTVPENGGKTIEYDVVFVQNGHEYHYPEAAPALGGVWVWLKRNR